MVRIAIDFECPSERWLGAGGRDLWDSVAEGFDNASVVLDRALAESVLAQAASIPGWDDGPEYAPHPLRLEEIDEDEEL